MPLGIANLGNTCSISTCIQCIHALSSLSSTLRGARFLKLEDITGELQRILQAMADRENVHSATYHIKPSRFVSMLYKHGGGLFPPGEQHDLCELWVWLMDRLHEAAASPGKIPMTRNNVEKAVLHVLHRYQQGLYSDILRVVQGSHISIVVCHHCGFRVSNVEPFSVMPLDITSDATLTDMVKGYMQLTPLDDWKCDRCSKRGASKMTRMFHCPKVLVIALNRFVMSSRGEMQKKGCNIHVAPHLVFHPPAVVSLSPEDPPITYTLKAVGNHFGSYGGGHYTATVRGDEEGAWFHMDDVSAESYENEERALQHVNGCGYLLFYERDDSN